VSSDAQHTHDAYANEPAARPATPSAEPSAERVAEDDPLSRDEVFEVLSNRRRRCVLHHLRRRGETVALGDLAEVVAAWENDRPIRELTSDERKRLYTALQQFHLPKMDETGLLEYDRDRGTVSLAETACDLDVYLDVVPEHEIPWSRYYLGLSALNVLLVAGLWLDLYPLTLLPDLAWIACFAVIFVGSAVAHTCHDRRMRLGAEDAPPDLPSR
jgi:DNA-binding transcriptional ArsR family regulator